MAEIVTGFGGLERRLAAISVQKSGRGYMKKVAVVVVGQMKLNIPHKTSGTSRSIHLDETSLTDHSARIVGNQIALWIDEGTGLFGPHHQRITPKAAKALRWTAGPAGSLRLTGRARKGKAGASARFVFARSTKGMEARPYIRRSVDQAGRKVGVKVKAEIIDNWNGAA